LGLFEVERETDAMKGSLKYSRNVNIPQYAPRDVKPDLMSLCDTHKYVGLLNRINASSVPENIKNFLRLSASRHIVFNYELIADYYAHADRETQQLMEDSALVIIDIDDAISNGYVKLSRRLKEIRNDGNLAKKAKDIK